MESYKIKFLFAVIVITGFFNNNKIYSSYKTTTETKIDPITKTKITTNTTNIERININTSFKTSVCNNIVKNLKNIAKENTDLENQSLVNNILKEFIKCDSVDIGSFKKLLDYYKSVKYNNNVKKSILSLIQYFYEVKPDATLKIVEEFIEEEKKWFKKNSIKKDTFSYEILDTLLRNNIVTSYTINKSYDIDLNKKNINLSETISDITKNIDESKKKSKLRETLHDILNNEYLFNLLSDENKNKIVAFLKNKNFTGNNLYSQYEQEKIRTQYYKSSSEKSFEKNNLNRLSKGFKYIIES